MFISATAFVVPRARDRSPCAGLTAVLFHLKPTWGPEFQAPWAEAARGLRKVLAMQPSPGSRVLGPDCAELSLWRDAGLCCGAQGSVYCLKTLGDSPEACAARCPVRGGHLTGPCYEG